MRKVILISMRQVWVIVWLILIGQGVYAYDWPHVAPSEELELREALQKLTDKYQVYFTYDKSLVQDIMVEYHDAKSTIEQELATLLQGTELQFRIFENQFVILYKLDDGGIRSLKSMVTHFETIITGKEKRDKLMPVNNGRVLNR